MQPGDGNQPPSLMQYSRTLVIAIATKAIFSLQQYILLPQLISYTNTDTTIIVKHSSNIVIPKADTIGFFLEMALGNQRQGITIEQRKALRQWVHQQHPKPTQKRCIEWFHAEYGHKLSQSTVSESLSSHFAHLDESTVDPKSQRLREGCWPKLEQVLFTWQT